MVYPAAVNTIGLEGDQGRFLLKRQGPLQLFNQ